MANQAYDDRYSMEIDASDDSFTYDGQSAPAAIAASIDPIEDAARFSCDKRLELPVNFSQTEQLEDCISEQSFTDSDEDDAMGESESNPYKPHASYPSNDLNIKYPEFRSEFEENKWSATYNSTGRFFVRKQSRDDPLKRDVDEKDIELYQLEEQFVNVDGSIWYNATGTKSAIKKVEEGPQMSPGPLDLAYYGAFYLNSDCRDAHDWLYTKDSTFEGRHAILIYKFHPELLSKKGKRVLDIKRWLNLAGERSKGSGKFEDDWTFTYQSSNPKDICKSGDNAIIRKRQDDQPAMQLIIYTEKMCRKIHPFLIGCIYFEKRTTPIDSLAVSSQSHSDQEKFGRAKRRK